MIWDARVSLLPTRYTRGEDVYFTKARALLSPMPLVPPTERDVNERVPRF